MQCKHAPTVVRHGRSIITRTRVHRSECAAEGCHVNAARWERLRMCK